jgi:hypothetical protein
MTDNQRTGQRPVFVIECRRSPASLFGAAAAILRSGGKPLVFDTREAAEAYAKELKVSIENEFLTYVVIERREV